AAKAAGLHASLVGAFLLVGMGLVAVIGGIRNRSKDEKLARHVTRWGGLVLLAAGLSADNLIVGFSLGLGNAEPLAVAGTIALFSVAFTWAGIHLGRESRRKWERSAKIGAGLLLVALGVATGLGWL
ncbi:MAG: manganese efflux pump MntP family protein, partial [Candidatus Krumholzibacteriia bacterium]